MRTSFVTGVIKTAMDGGLSEDQATALLQGALEHPDVQDMFTKMAAETGPELASGELEMLSHFKTAIESQVDMEIIREMLDAEIKPCAS